MFLCHEYHFQDPVVELFLQPATFGKLLQSDSDSAVLLWTLGWVSDRPTILLPTKLSAVGNGNPDQPVAWVNLE